jgi:hypothetical protein
MDEIEDDRAAPISCMQVQDTSLNSGKNCLDGWVHFKHIFRAAAFIAIGNTLAPFGHQWPNVQLSGPERLRSFLRSASRP